MVAQLTVNQLVVGSNPTPGAKSYVVSLLPRRFAPRQADCIFGLKNNLLASIDILLVVGMLIWALYAVWHASPELRWVVYVNIPYLLWGIFATCLQLTITYLNK